MEQFINCGHRAITADFGVIMWKASGLTFPVRADESPLPPFPLGPTGDNNTEAEPQRNAAAPVVLLVEDNASDVYVIQRALKQCGIRIILQLASDGEQALATLKRYEDGADHLRPSLIMLDWNLPRISGAEVLTFVRQSEQWRNVPVLVVTSTSLPGDISDTRRLGATAHFRKPTDLDAYLDLGKVVLDLISKPHQAPS